MQTKVAVLILILILLFFLYDDSFAEDTYVSAIAWHPTSSFLAVGDSNGNLTFSGSSESVPTFSTTIEGLITDLAWSIDGKRLAASTAEDTIHIWQYNDNTFIHIAVFSGHGNVIEAIAWNPNGSQVMSVSYIGSDFTVMLWDTVTYDEAPDLAMKLCEPTDISWNHENNIVAIPCAVGVYVFDGNQLNTILPSLTYDSMWSYAVGNFDIETALDWDTSTARLVVGDKDGDIQVLSSNYEVILERNVFSTWVATLDWHPSQDIVAGVDINGEIEVFSVVTGETLAVYHTDNQDLLAFDIAWSPSGDQLVFTNGTDGLTFLDTETPEAPTSLAVTASPPVALVWQDNSADEDGFIVSRQIDGGEWQDIATLPADSTAFTDAACGNLAYRVRATRTSPLPLDSLPSNAVSFVVDCPTE